jgi:hypothetical protein
MSQDEYALCRAVADGWLVLDRGSLRRMDEAREATEWHELTNEDRYVVMHTAVAVGEIAGADGLPLDGTEDRAESFGEFMRQRVASERHNRETAARPRQKQALLLTHLDDLPSQGVLFEEDP